MPTAPADRDPAELIRQVSDEQWYHTFELAPGVVTPGWLDHRPVVGEIPFPASLEGKRCLDVGTFDGFWAFEMERRGGAVTAIDLLDPVRWEWPPDSPPEAIAALAERKRSGSGFELVKSILDSRVERLDLSVYDLDPTEHGRFDFIYLGSLLLHLRDPVRALSVVRSVCAGTLVVCDAYSPLYSRLVRRPMATLEGAGRPWWWRPNLAGLERMVEAAGFDRRGPTRTVRIPAGPGRAKPPLSLAVLRHPTSRQELSDVWLGDPHGVIEAAPAA